MPSIHDQISFLQRRLDKERKKENGSSAAIHLLQRDIKRLERRKVSLARNSKASNQK